PRRRRPRRERRVTLRRDCVARSFFDVPRVADDDLLEPRRRSTMHRKLSSLGLAVALAAGLFAATPGTALARDQTGLGIGANVSLGGLSGLALNIWVTRAIMLEAMITTQVGIARGDGHDAVFSIGGSFG